MELLEKLLNLGDEVKNAAPLSERIMMGIETTLLGMGVVFLALIVLWAVLSVFRLVFYKPDGKAAESVPAPAEITPAVAQAEAVSTANDEEIVAVITAAIAAMTGKPETSFRVVSFRRTASK